MPARSDALEMATRVSVRSIHIYALAAGLDQSLHDKDKRVAKNRRQD
jgi:hypothetical protein